MTGNTTPQRIGIDCRFAATQSGIGRYTRELVRHLLRRDDPWSYVLFIGRGTNSAPRGLKPAANNKHALEPLLPHPRATSYKLQATSYSLREHCELPRAIKYSGISLLHVPHFNVPFRSSVPFIATIHDLILHHFPNEASLLKQAAYRLMMGGTVRRAAHLIAVSETTAEDIRTIYGEEARRKTSVLHEGVSPDFRPVTREEQERVRKQYALPATFFLYVGAAKEHKNVQALIDACPDEHTLLLVTGGKEVKRLRLRGNVRILTDIAEGDLPTLYSAARCYVSPSLAEGFNLPVLEAMACGCPVIATRRGSTPEIAGGFASLIEPTVENLRQSLRGPLPQDIEGARAHAVRFSWERMAEETARVYAAALPL